MSVCLLTPVYLPITFMGQYVYLHVNEEGGLRIREVYDIFFKCPMDLDTLRVRCISPHDLLLNTADCEQPTIAATVAKAPGSHGKDDVVYETPVGYGASFDPNNGLFTISVAETDPEGSFVPRKRVLTGKVVVPTVGLLDNMADKEAITISQICGTVFELGFDRLVKGEDYAVRLVLEPVNLLGLSARRDLQYLETPASHIHWAQDATLFCPKFCRFNYSEYLASVAPDEFPEYADSINGIRAVVDSDEWITAPIRRQRLILVAPSDCSIDHHDSTVGLVWWVTKHVLADGRPAEEFGSGCDTYWMGDAESIAIRAWQYLHDKMQDQPTHVDKAMTEIGTDDENTRLILEQLQEEEVLLANSDGTIQAKPGVTDDEANTAILATARNGQVRRNFFWRGYEIRYTLMYKYLSNEAKRRIRVASARQDIGFYASIVATVLSLISLWITLAALSP